MRIDAILCHQAGKRGTMFMEMLLLDPPSLLRLATEQPLDELAHADVDQLEQICRSRIEAVVEIEDPAIDVAKGGKHGCH
jgi:hypothetical protein